MSEQPNQSNNLNHAVELHNLTEKQHYFKHELLKKFEELEEATERSLKESAKLQIKLQEQEQELTQLKARIGPLEEKIQDLTAENSRLKQSRLEQIRDLDRQMDMLTKKRRQLSYTLSSPLSPTFNVNDSDTQEEW